MFHNIGIIFDHSNDYEKAMEYYEKGLLVAREIGDSEREGILLGDIGLLHSHKGEFEKAINCYELAHSILSKFCGRKLEAALFSLIGRNYVSMGNRQKGKELLEKAAAIEVEIDSKYMLCYDLVFLADLFFTEGNIDEAYDKATKSNDIACQLTQKTVIDDCSILLLKIAHAKGQQEEALNGLKEMLAKTEEEEQKATIHYELWKMMRDVGATLVVAQDKGQAQDLSLPEPAPDADVGATRASPAEEAEEHRQTATELYTKQYEKTPKYEYKKKIEEMKASSRSK